MSGSGVLRNVRAAFAFGGEDMLTLEALRAKPHLSVHSLKTFLDCPRKWRLRYVERVEPAFRPVALVLGSALHEGVGYAFTKPSRRRAKKPSAARAEVHEVVKERLLAELRGEGPPVLLEDDETEDDLIAMGAALLDVVLDDLPVPERVLGIEVPFRLELFDPDTGEQLDRPLVGAIDLVTNESCQVVYTELKSGKKRWSDDQVAFDFQLTAYGMALRTRGYRRPRPRLVVATKTKTPSVQIESPHRGPEHERDLAATAASVLRGVKAGVDHPVRSWACKTCPYAGACR